MLFVKIFARTLQDLAESCLKLSSFILIDPAKISTEIHLDRGLLRILQESL